MENAEEPQSPVSPPPAGHPNAKPAAPAPPLVIPAIPDFLRSELLALGVTLDDERLARLAHYLGLLLQANEQFNLTAIREPDAAWRRHIIDSLTALPGLEDLPASAIVADVGSGGGLPGIPLAIARPDLRFTLMEATGKKANFLKHCVDVLPLPLTRVVQERAEITGQDPKHRSRYDAAVCRAIGPMTEVLEYTLPLLREGGRLLAMKGPKAEQELRDAADALDVLGAGEMEVYAAYPDGSEQNTVIISIIKERPTPKTYPRRPGVPKQTPIGGGRKE